MIRTTIGAVADAGRTPVRVIHTAKAMLPKLRIILAAMIATCAAVLALSAGLLGTRDPGNDLSGVPDVSRMLVRQAIVEDPEWQQFHLLAYSRRADELQRLRDLPVTPVRAVVEYAEQARARAESADAPAAPVTTPPADTAAAAAPAATPAPTVVASAPAAPSSVDAPPSPADDMPPLAAAPADTPSVAPAPAAPPSDTTVAAVPASLPAIDAPAVTAPPETAAAPVPAPAPAAPAASADTQVATVQAGVSETAEMYGPEQPKAGHKRRHGPRAAHAHPATQAKPKKPAVARVNRGVAPSASTGFTVDTPDNRSSTSSAPRFTGSRTR